MLSACEVRTLLKFQINCQICYHHMTVKYPIAVNSIFTLYLYVNCCIIFHHNIVFHLGMPKKQREYLRILHLSMCISKLPYTKILIQSNCKCNKIKKKNSLILFLSLINRERHGSNTDLIYFILHVHAMQYGSLYDMLCTYRLIVIYFKTRKFGSLVLRILTQTWDIALLNLSPFTLY